MDASTGSAVRSEMKVSPNIVLRGNGKASAPKRSATGRPSTYTEAKAAEICRRMVEGESLRTICKAPGMPTFVTVFNWRRAHPEFLEQYAREREDQADALAEEMLDVARSALRAKSSEEAQGYRLLVDTLKWRASKMKPRSYGDKLLMEAEVNVRQMTRRATERPADTVAGAPARDAT